MHCLLIQSDYMQYSLCIKIPHLSAQQTFYNLIMYQFAVQRDQQQTTTLTVATDSSIAIVKTHRIASTNSPQTNNKLLIEFNIHENHEESAKWAALEHSLRVDFQDFVAGEMLPTSMLKVHIFILKSGSDLQSVIFNGTWLNFVLHGVPLKRSVFHYNWNNKAENKAVFDLHCPSTILSGVYSCAPPGEMQRICGEYRSAVTDFLRREWVK